MPSLSITFKNKEKFFFIVFFFVSAAILGELTIMTKSCESNDKVKQANVSGQFYSADPKKLSFDIESYFNKASVLPSTKDIAIVIAPHAGYVYSGPVAAYSFKAVSAKKYNTIIILAPSHFYGFDGISIWSEGAFQTPLGTVAVDEEVAKKLTSSHEKFYFEPKAFEREHALEVEIPFLQKTFKDFKIVPVIMGQPSPDVLKAFAATLNQLIGERNDVLIVVSTDLSHYHDDGMARKMDNHTLDLIKELKVEEIWKKEQAGAIEMCGFIPVVTALLYAKIRGFSDVEVLRYANSSDVTGDKERVVGYSSVVIYSHEDREKSASVTSGQVSEEKNPLSHTQKKKLIEVAKTTIHAYLQTGQTLEFKEDDPRLLHQEGSFVTIRKHSLLRGCIGSVLGQGPLYLTVRDMAIAAAVRDPRFPPVKKEELKDLEIEVSVLSIPWEIKSADEIVLGKHGVIISQGPFHQGLFLPQVAEETGWDKKEFLSELCSQKAGLSRDCWKDPRTKFLIFTAQVFSEKDVE